MDFRFFLTNILLGVGLAMDAFSVSMANGLSAPNMPKKHMFLIAGTFAVFQAVMPMTGWVLVHTVVGVFSFFDKAVPWIALALLGYIGGGMIYEGMSHKKEEEEEKMGELCFRALLVQGVATSIDALSVGFTIADYDRVSALVVSLIIAAVTFAICFSGVFIGRAFGMKLAGKASVLGGVILIAIGFKIFISGLIK